MIDFTGQDGRDLQLINWLAKADHKKKKLCYQLKDILLKKYGVADGFDLQEFTRPCWSDDDYGVYGDQYYSGETFSWHEHILARHKIGNLTFHSPTDDFRYRNINHVKKESPYFDFAKAHCREKIDEIKEVPKGFNKPEAIKAFRRIVCKFKPLFRETIVKKPRPKYPFIIPKFWMNGDFDEFRVRVPAPYQCACGRKLRLEIHSWDLAKMKLGVFSQFRERLIDCDFRSEVNYFKYKDDENCPNYLIRLRQEFRCSEDINLVPYQEELKEVSVWAQEFFLEHWDEFLPTMIGIEKRIEEIREDLKKEVLCQI